MRLEQCKEYAEECTSLQQESEVEEMMKLEQFFLNKTYPLLTALCCNKQHHYTIFYLYFYYH